MGSRRGGRAEMVRGVYEACQRCGRLMPASELPVCGWTCASNWFGRGSHKDRCKWYQVPYDAAVTAQKVYARDDYTCQMCGEKVLKSGGYYVAYVFKKPKRKKHPRSPSVDHIVPLYRKQKGHTWDNVRTCCLHCNCGRREPDHPKTSGEFMAGVFGNQE